MPLVGFGTPVALLNLVTGEVIGDMPSPDDVLPHMRAHVEECRSGDFGEFECLYFGIRTGVVSLEGLDLTQQELDEFRMNGRLEPATRYLQECREGNLENLGTLVEWIQGGVLTVAELSTTDTELITFITEMNKRWRRKVLQECREGNLENVEGLTKALAGDRRGRAAAMEEIGISKDELLDFAREADYAKAQEIAAKCRTGDFSDLGFLATVVEHDLLTAEQFQELDLDLDTWRREHMRNVARQLHERAQQDDPFAANMLRTAIRLGDVDPDDLDITAADFDRMFGPTATA